MSKLTSRQENFIRGLVHGLSQRQAYIKSYSTENMSPQVIDNLAYRLAKQEKIHNRYIELLEEVSEKIQWTRVQDFYRNQQLLEEAWKDIEVNGLSNANVRAYTIALKAMRDNAITNLEKAKLKAEIRKIEAEADIVHAEAQKISKNSEGYELMKSLVHAVKGRKE